MSLAAEYKHSYWGITISGTATVPLPVTRNRYLRFCFGLIYLLITEAEESQSANVGWTEGHAPLLTDAIPPCIKQLLHRYNLNSSADGCCLSLPSTSLRTAGRSAAEIVLFSESFNGYAGCKYGRLWVHSLLSWSYLWRGCGPLFRQLTLFSHFSLLIN